MPKPLLYQIWLTNTKLFFLQKESNLKTLIKFSPYIEVSYKFILKSANSLRGIIWAIEYWFKAL